MIGKIEFQLEEVRDEDEEVLVLEQYIEASLQSSKKKEDSNKFIFIAVFFF